ALATVHVERCDPSLARSRRVEPCRRAHLHQCQQGPLGRDRARDRVHDARTAKALWASRGPGVRGPNYAVVECGSGGLPPSRPLFRTHIAALADSSVEAEETSCRRTESVSPGRSRKWASCSAFGLRWVRLAP